MLERFQRLAVGMAPLRPAFWLLALGAFAALVYLLLGGTGRAQDRWLLPLSMLLVWGLSLEAMVLCFTAIPPRPHSGLGLFRRLWWRLKRALAATVALLFMVLLLILVWFSIRSLTLPL